MKRMDFDGLGAWPGRWRTHGLSVVEGQLLPVLRQMARVQPIGSAQCPGTHAALQRDFGEAALGVEHLLRCCLVGLARKSARVPGYGELACPLLTEDEARLFDVLRAAGRDDARAAQLLSGFGGSAAALLPLFVALDQAVSSVGARFIAKVM